MNWKDLKEFANSLDEEQLEREVILWREDEAIDKIEAMTLEDDHYIGDGEDGCYTLADAGLTEEDVKERGLTKVYTIGFPLLHEDF